MPTHEVELPPDLMVDMRQGRILLFSPALSVTVEIDNGRHGPFRDGPVSWAMLKMAYIAPALDQFRAASLKVRQQRTGDEAV